MKTGWKATIAGLTLALTIFAGTSAADDPAAELAKAGAPGPEHAKLQPLAGSWTYTCKCWMEPGKSPIETKGTIERKWILGGRFLKEKIAGTGFDGKPGFEGFGLLGYDNVLKKYTMTWVCNMGTGVSNGVGVAESSTKFTFQTTCSCPMEKKTIQGRDVLRIESPDRVVMETYFNQNGKEVKMMEIISVRAK